MLPSTRRPLHWLLPALAALGGCGNADTTPMPTRTGPDPWANALRVAPAPDRNPDPRVVEVDLEARVAEWEVAPGRRVRAMTYNGQVPGPTIEARVGDTLIVHFTNRLEEPTTIHWHGVRVPANMDGGPHSQPPIAPGASFDYRFTVEDAGTFWFHPHMNERVQMERGLYGAIVVRGPREPLVDAEGVLVLDDLLLDASGQIAPTGDLVEQHNGREGALSLVNGRSGAAIPMRAGQRQRWRIVNAGSARYYRLSLPGHRFTVIGTDGGPIATPRTSDELLMVPGDRLDVIVDGTGAPGSTATLQNLAYERGHGAGLTAAVDVLRVQYASDVALPRLAAPAAGARIEPLATAGVTPRAIAFNERIDRDAERVVFMINGRSYPDVPDIVARIDTTEVWDLHNESEMEHPFHLHGFFFQVVSRNGVAEPEPTWEDTIQLRGEERVRIAFRPDNRPGHWMYHCHILEHVDNGMMGAVDLRP